MNYKSPFTIWFDTNITQMAVSPEILKLLAKAFEGGRLSVQTKPLSNEEINEIIKQQDWFSMSWVDMVRRIEERILGK